MDITEQIAAVEARIETNTEAFVNNDAASHEERAALASQIREDTAVLETLRAALMRLQ